MFLLIIIIYVLIRVFYGAETIDNFLLSIGNLMKNKKYPLYKTAEYFNTPQLRQRWWDSLDAEWKIIFKFQLIDFHAPIDDKVIKELLNNDAIPLDLENVDNLNGLKYLTNLKHLIIYNYNSTDLSGLKHLSKLTKLEMFDADFSSGLPIASLKRIEKLRLCNCKLNSATQFKYLKKLRKLYLNSNNIKDISPLAKINNLDFLSLEGNPITDFKALADLKQTKIVLSFNQKYNLQHLYNNNINVIIPLPNVDYQSNDEFYTLN